MGPVLVTPDELDDPDDPVIECCLNGEQVQHSRTSDMIFPVAEIIARLSTVTPLLPGDVIFTGTPAGVGLGRTPQRFIQVRIPAVDYEVDSLARQCPGRCEAEPLGRCAHNCPATCDSQVRRGSRPSTRSYCRVRSAVEHRIGGVDELIRQCTHAALV